MERMWSADASVKYPKQWIVMVNVSYDSGTHKYMGDIYDVKPTSKEAYDVAKNLGDSMGKRMVVDGFDDTPQIGGLAEGETPIQIYTMSSD